MDELLTLQHCPLFEGIMPQDITHVLGCLDARRADFGRNQAVYRAGEAPRELGVVLSGSVDVLREDWWGKRVLMQRIGPGGLFGESFAMAEAQRLPVDVVAREPSRVLFLNARSILTGCAMACHFHTRLIYNAARLLAQKNIALTRSMEHLTRRTIREKLLSYLNGEAQRLGSDTFSLGLNRQELADTLCVDRSAMCAVLSALKSEGKLDYHRERFTLYGACSLPEPQVLQP